MRLARRLVPLVLLVAIVIGVVVARWVFTALTAA